MVPGVGQYYLRVLFDNCLHSKFLYVILICTKSFLGKYSARFASDIYVWGSYIMNHIEVKRGTLCVPFGTLKCLILFSHVGFFSCVCGFVK